ncbi:CAP domain-containing protein [Streptomyces sp. NPDC004129]
MICGLISLGPTQATSAHARGFPDAPTCSSSGSPPGTGSKISAADAANLVRAHNDARRAALQKYNAAHPMVSVTWNPKLACDAQAWADDPASTRGGKLNHSSRTKNGNEGENLFNAYPGPPRPMMAMDPGVSFSWMAEKSKFDAANNAPINSNAAPGRNYRVWGHYSQIVWMSPASTTTSIGCGVKQGVPVMTPRGTSTTGWILVCRYLAAGNINGQRAIPPSGSP